MARVQHSCTGCVPIDASIIDVYIQLLGLKDSTIEAAERAEYAAEHAIGKSPYIGENGDWWEWDDEQGVFIDTGVQAQSSIAVDTQLDPTSTNPVQNKVTTQALAGKQATLVSGTNIKTINDESILGAGNIVAGDPNAVKYVDQSLTDAQKSQARTNIGAGTYSKAGTGIPKSDLASSVQTSLGKADTAIQDISGKQDVISDLSTIRSGAAAGATAYQKPVTGIPASDIASGVIPTVPTISTDVSADAASDVKTSSPKSVKTYVDSGIAAVESDLSDLEDVVGAIDIGAYVIAWDGNSTPVVANIPAGVTVTYNTTTYTGELAASASTIQKIYLVATGTTDNYDRYITVDDSTYSWVNLGTTEITLADYATKTEVSQLEHKVTEIGKESILDEDDEIVVTDDLGNEVLKITDEYVDAKNLKKNGQDVLTSADVSGKADKTYVDEELAEKQDKVTEISTGEAEDGESEISIQDDEGNPIHIIKEGYADFKNLRSNGLPVSTRVLREIEEEEFGHRDEEILLTGDDGNTTARFRERDSFFENITAKNFVSANSSERKYIDSLEQSIAELKRNMLPLYSFKTRNNGTRNEINLANNRGGNYLITLHRTTNDGTMDTTRSAYLPNAEINFSDVRIYDADGNTIPYRVLGCGNYDVLQSTRVASLYGYVREFNQVLYCGGRDGSIRKSEDGGNTWSVLSELSSNLSGNVMVCAMTAEGTMFIGEMYTGKLYRSVYPFTTKTLVLDCTIAHSDSLLLPTSVAVDEEGNIFVGHYQVERDIIIEKSIDDGQTFTVCYRDDSGKYQHIHRIEFDTDNNKLYVGCDGGGGILVSDDNGESFVDLRDSNTIPQATDYGLIYFDPNFRLFGGETSIVGGSTIIRSSDDQNFVPILGTGKACYNVIKMGENYFASLISSGSFRYTELLVSKDLSKWEIAFVSAQHNDGGASDGFRLLSQISGDTAFAIVHGASYRNSIIKAGGQNYSAQILVPVKQGVEKLYIEDGYAARFTEELYNEERTQSPLFYAPLTGICGDYIVGETPFNDGNVFAYSNGGRHIGDIYPNITSFRDMYSAKLFDADVPFATAELSIPSSYHIGFWMKSEGNCEEFSILSTSGYDVHISHGYQLYINSVDCGSINSPRVSDVFIRVDINIQINAVEIYINGMSSSTKSAVITSPPANATYQMLTKRSYDTAPFTIQHFEISGDVIAEDDARRMYNAKVFDNQ